ncbi:MAG: hypothetical protein AAF975_01045, partial [Spirochaetota bacterium]
MNAPKYPRRGERPRRGEQPSDTILFYPGWRFFFFFSLILYTLWWHKPRFGNSWENIWGLNLLLILGVISLSF